MAVVFANNAKTTLASSVSTTATSITVADGSVFPAISGSDYTYVTFEDTSSNIEVVKVTARSGNTLTVVRGQDGTTAKAYSAGDKCELRITAALLNDLNTEADTESVSRDGDSMTGDLSLGDGNKVIFGAGSDLEIYHTGAASYIEEKGTGSLYIKGTQLRMQATDGTTYIEADDGGAVTLKYSGSNKIATTSTGIDVTGTVVSDGLTVDGGTNLLTRTSSGAEVDVLEVRNNATATSTASTIKFVNSTAAGSNSGSSELVAVRTGTNTGEFKIRTSNTSAAMQDIVTVNSSGIDVTGTATVDGLTSSGAISAPGQTISGQVGNFTSGLSVSGTYSTTVGTNAISFSRDGTSYIDQSSTNGNGMIVFRLGSTYDQRLNIGNSAVVFNEESDDVDFRVESNSKTHMLFVDGGNDAVALGTTDIDNQNNSAGSAADNGFAYNLGSGGYLSVARYGGTVAYLNRTDSDGTILDIRKDGSTVGTLGSNTARFFIHNNYGTGSGFRFDNGFITPASAAGAAEDKTTDLGSSAARWKNAYFSGVDITNDSDRGRIRLWANASLGSEMRIFNANGYGLISMINNHPLVFHTNSVERLELGSNAAVFNDVSADVDFRIESDNKSHLFYVDASNDGVGIGDGYTLANGLKIASTTSTTNAIDTKLYLQGLSSGTTTTGFGVGITFAGARNGDGGNQQMAQINAIAEVNSGTTLSSGLSFQTATAGVNSEKMRIQNDGKIRLGNSSDHALVDVSASNAAIKLIDNNQSNPPTIRGNGPNFTLENQGYNRIAMYSGSTVVNDDSRDQDFRVESNNNANMLFVDAGNDAVGIGHSSPTAVLDVRRSDVSGLVAEFHNNVGYGIDIGTSTAEAYISSGYQQDFLLKTDAGSGQVERLRIDSSGKLLIGDGDSHTSDLLQIETPASGGGHGIQIRRNDSNTSQGIGHILFGNNTDTDLAKLAAGTDGQTDAGYLILATQPTGGSLTDRLTIASNGDVVFNETSTDSDFRVESDNNFTALFVDAGNDRIGLFEDAPTAPLHLTTTSAGTAFLIESSDAGSSGGPIITLDRSSSSPANGDTLGMINFNGRNDAGEHHNYARIESRIVDVANATEDGRLELSTSVGTTEGLSRLLLNGTETVVNDNSADLDFRVESDSNTHALFVDAEYDRIGINTNAPDQLVHIFGGNSGSAYSPDGADLFILENSDSAIIDIRTPAANSGGILFSDAGARGRGQILYSHSTDTLNFTTASAGRLSLSGSATIFNDGSADTDFRVESDNNANAFFVEGSTGKVNMGSGTAQGAHLNIDGAISGGYGSFIRMNNAGTNGACGFIGATDGNWNIGSGKVIIGRAPQTSGPSSSYADIAIGLSDLVINENGYDKDFRVESNNDANCLLVDASQDSVKIGATSGTRKFNVTGDAEITTSTNNLYLTSNGGSNYTQGAMVISSGTTSSPQSRGQGIYFFNEGTDTTWYTGTQYNAGSVYSINIQNSTSSFAENTASYTYSAMSFYPTATGTIVNDNGHDRDFRVESDNVSHAIFVDASNDRVVIGDSSGSGLLTVSKSHNGLTYSDISNTSQAAGADGAITRLITSNNAGSGTTSADIVKRKNGQFGLINNETDSGAIFYHTLGTTEAMRHSTSGTVFNENSANRDFRVESDGVSNCFVVDAQNNTVSMHCNTSYSFGTGTQTGTFFANGGFIGHTENNNNAALILRKLTNTGTMVRFYQDNAVIGSISTTSTATAYNTSSDERLKENIADAQDAGGLIDAIQVRQFDWKKTGEHQRYGVVAQEVDQVTPEITSTSEEDGFMSVDYSKLVPMLIKEIQSLRARVAQLESN